MAFRSRYLFPVLILAGFLFPTAIRASADTDSILTVYQAGMTALQGGDYEAYYDRMTALDGILPFHPAVLRRIAGGAVLSGRTNEAFAALDRFMALDVYHDLDADTTFASLREDPRYPGVRARLDHLLDPVMTSTPAFYLPEKDLLTEGLAFDPAAGRFFVSSVHRRKILVVEGLNPVALDPATARVHDFAVFNESDRTAPLGLAIDSTRRRLWVASAATEQMAGFRPGDGGMTALIAFDLDTGDLVRSIAPPDTSGPHAFNDITVDSMGSVYVSDPQAQMVYRLAPGADGLEPVTGPDLVGGVNGLALSADEKTLFLSDYSRGLLRVELSTGAVTEIGRPDNLCLLGVDGLTRSGEDLVAIQNGVLPHRVLRLELDDQGRNVIRCETLDRNHTGMNEPTLGVVVGSRLFYIANSQWELFGLDGSVDGEALETPVVLSRDLQSTGLVR